MEPFDALRETMPLASAPLTPEIQADYLHFSEQILQRTGIDLRLYKEAQMLRRLYHLVERAGLNTFRDYLTYLNHDPAALNVLLDRMTINVSELFRNPEKWEELEGTLLPNLLKVRPTLKLWSAGCSYGAEPYSLAILLEELTPGRKHVLHATDLDRTILKKAQAARFSTNDVASLSEARRKRYFLPCSPPSEEETLNHANQHSDLMLIPALRERVLFRRHNLLADPFESGYDLICCRNVVIYFTDEAKERLYARFFDALAPGGYLFIGGTERIFHYGRIGYEMPSPFLYRKPLKF